MTERRRSRGSRWFAHVLDARGWAELGLIYVALTLALVVLIARLGRASTDAAPSGSNLLTVVAIAAAVGAIGVAGTAWSWARNGGRPAQRLGRRVWRSGQLPDDLGQHVVALRDLQRRRRLLQRRTPRIVVTAIWAVLTTMQIWIDHSIGNIALWLAIFATFLVSGIRDHLDRRHLPELDALLSDRPAQEAPVPKAAAPY